MGVSSRPPRRQAAKAQRKPKLDKAATRVAKIAPPRLAGVYPRKRLFKALDRARRHPVVWIAAPAGYGKTTLVASYLKARKLPALWYQLDNGDADVATYFHYLGLAAKRAAPRVRWSLPAFTPEYFAALPIFARRYFEQLAARMPARTVAVLDNYQDVPAEALLHEVIHNGLSRIPQGMNAIIISRYPPPPAYVADRANDVIIVIDHEALRLTEAESIGICRARRPRAPAKLVAATARQIHQRSHGWAAAFVLMVKRSSDRQSLLTAPEHAAEEVMFDYFYRELFQKTDNETQQMLLHTAFLPSITPVAAEQLAKNPKAGDILAQLQRGNFFTLRHAGPALVYQYHPLLRDFLAAQVHRLLGDEQRTALMRASAGLLAQEGRIEDAAQLLQAAGDWATLAMLIKQHAQVLLESGRHHTVTAWLEKLPSALREGDTWLLFWLGACRFPFDTTDAREILTQAYIDFRARSDGPGVFLAWASAVEAIVFEWADFSQLDRWIEDLDELTRLFPTFPSSQIEARVVSAMVSALMYQQPHHPHMEQWCQRLEAILRHIPNPSTRVLLGAHLLIYYLIWLRELAAADRILGLIRPPRGAKLSAIAEIMWNIVLGNWCWVMNRPEEALAAVTAAQHVADDQGVMLWNFIIYATGADITLSRCNLEAARPYIERLEQLLVPRRRMDVGHYLVYVAWSAGLRGDYARAVAAARETLAICIFNQAETSAYLCHSHMGLAQLLHMAGESREALTHASQALEIGVRMRSTGTRYWALWCQAWIHLESGHEAEACEHLRAAFALGRVQGYARLTFYYNNPQIFAKLCCKALEAGIEMDYARAMIRERELLPPLDIPVPESWPWPVKVHALGRFAVHINDKPLKFDGKSKKKPLELLKALIAFGGRAVSEDKLAEALWPDAEADAATRALTTTLHRLRGLIGETTIARQEGRLTLDARRCWVDAWSFERQLATLESASRTQSPDEITELTDKLMVLYRGAFLQGDLERPWVLSTRERLRGKLLRLLESVGTTHARVQRHDQARRCFEKALEIDTLAEGFYRGLMQINLAAGRHAEALSVYRRCRKMLSLHFGCAPSAEIEALAGLIQKT